MTTIRLQPIIKEWLPKRQISSFGGFYRCTAFYLFRGCFSLHARVAKRSNALDSRSSDLVSSEVRILPRATSLL